MRADLFCDDWEQASHGGELATAVEAGSITRENVTELGDVLAGTGRRQASSRGHHAVRLDRARDPGLAIAKVALAKAEALDLPRLAL